MKETNMCQATSIEYLRSFCKEFHAVAPKSFWDAPDDVLKRTYNGIGAEYWSPKIRAVITAVLRPLQAAAFVHDWEFSQPDKSFSNFTIANYHLALNVAKEAIYDCRPSVIPAGIAAAVLCELFGYRAYKAGRIPE